MESLDNILSGQGNDSPAPEVKPVEPAEKPAEVKTETTEPQDDVTVTPEGRKMVPLEALTETRGKVKRYTEQVAQFEQSITGMREQNATLQRQVTELLQRLPQPQQPQQQPVDFFADPDAALKSAFQHNLAPLQSQLAETRLALVEERLARVAGPEKAAKIEEELGRAMNAGDPEIHLLRNALQSQGPAAVKLLVEWFDKRTFDPAAERERLKAELLAELQTQKPPAQPSVMPSNLANARNVGTRAGPPWAGPTPLADIFKK